MLARMALDAVTATVSSVSGSATAVTLLAATSARVGASVFNDSTAILYLKCGSSASSTDYTVQMAAGSYFELPLVIGRSGTQTVYAGIITGIWASATGSARITEFS